MARKGENIHKRKDGRWEARISNYKGSKLPKYHSVYGKTYSEVKKKKMLYIENMNSVVYRSEEKLFKDVLQMWMTNNYLNKKESTRLKYQSIIDAHIKNGLGNIEINQIDDVMINNFLNEKIKSGRIDNKGGLSNSYVKSMAIIINSVMNYAANKGYCKPLKAKINKPMPVKKEITVLSETEQLQLEAALRNDNSLVALGTMIALNTGLRIGEICALKWGNIDLDNRIIKVRNSVIRVSNNESLDGNSGTKTKYIIDNPKTKTSVRDIPITTKLYSVLKKSINNNSYVVSENNQFICPRTFEYRYHQILKKYCVKDTNFHTLRHTFATRCVEKNVDIKTLSEILGHSSVNITLNTYVHPSFETKRTQLEKICC